MIRAVIVDDQTLFAEAISAALEAKGYHVVEVVSGGSDAVDVARKVRPDLVLMDLPHGDVDLGRRIVKELPTAKVLALTGRRDPELVYQTMRAGFHGFVTKHAGMAQFVESLDAVFEGRRVVPGRATLEVRTGDDRPRSGGIPTEPLTPREQQILDLLGEGVRTRQIAAALHIAPNTVRSHVQALLTKLRVHSRLEAVAFARRHHLTTGGRDRP
jgi:two-component system, NarL family, nitrate/nitrite response regulator NarL